MILLLCGTVLALTNAFRRGLLYPIQSPAIFMGLCMANSSTPFTRSVGVVKDGRVHLDRMFVLWLNDLVKKVDANQSSDGSTDTLATAFGTHYTEIHMDSRVSMCYTIPINEHAVMGYTE